MPDETPSEVKEPQRQGKRTDALWRFYGSLFDGTVGEVWFRWVGWLLVVAALHAAGIATGSVVLKIFSYISAALVTTYALNFVDVFNEFLIGDVRDESPWILRLLFFILALGVGLAFIVSLSNAMDSIFDLGSVEPAIDCDADPVSAADSVI